MSVRKDVGWALRQMKEIPAEHLQVVIAKVMTEQGTATPDASEEWLVRNGYCWEGDDRHYDLVIETVKRILDERKAKATKTKPFAQVTSSNDEVVAPPVKKAKK